jgi:hypothetical protein
MISPLFMLAIIYWPSLQLTLHRAWRRLVHPDEPNQSS